TQKRGTRNHGKFCHYGQGRPSRRVKLHRPVHRRGGHQDAVDAECPWDDGPCALRDAARCRSQERHLEQWEMDETWVVVSSNTMRALGFTRSNARPGEKAVGALVIFQATDVREATADERKALMEARKASKLQARQRRAQRKAEREASKAKDATPV